MTTDLADAQSEAQVYLDKIRPWSTHFLHVFELCVQPFSKLASSQQDVGWSNRQKARSTISVCSRKVGECIKVAGFHPSVRDSSCSYTLIMLERQEKVFLTFGVTDSSIPVTGTIPSCFFFFFVTTKYSGYETDSCSLYCKSVYNAILKERQSCLDRYNLGKYLPQHTRPVNQMHRKTRCFTQSFR